MPTEMEDLLEFLKHGNTQIRQAAVEHLLPYSESDPAIFKAREYAPVKDLKLLTKDYSPIAKNVLLILINISKDSDVLKQLAPDDAFLETLLGRVTNKSEPNANEVCMLLANLAKSDSISRLLTLKRPVVASLSSDSKLAIDQLLDVFIKGANEAWNPKANYDYLAYLFADLATVRPLSMSPVYKPPICWTAVTKPRHKLIKCHQTQSPDARKHFTTPSQTPTPTSSSPSDWPLTSLLPFLSHPSHIRRLGVSSLLKNLTFTHSLHIPLLNPPISLLPYLLSPLMGPEPPSTYSDSETDLLPLELQYLGKDKAREPDAQILKVHLETLLILASASREGREVLRGNGTYAVLRECHLHIEGSVSVSGLVNGGDKEKREREVEEVREGCERLVQVLMRDEEGEEGGKEVGEAHLADEGTRRLLGGGGAGASANRGNGKFGGQGRMVTEDKKVEVEKEPPGRMVTQAHDNDDDEEDSDDDKVVQIA
ncbi:hypothetical protein MMC25_007532 [Agyrium rufum]|nr:hypothetical protein [Agyrium rufum]